MSNTGWRFFNQSVRYRTNRAAPAPRSFRITRLSAGHEFGMRLALLYRDRSDGGCHRDAFEEYL
jgi:hypothetical protein